MSRRPGERYFHTNIRLRSRSMDDRGLLKRRSFSQNHLSAKKYSLEDEQTRSVTQESTSGSEYTTHTNSISSSKTGSLPSRLTRKSQSKLDLIQETNRKPVFETRRCLTSRASEYPLKPCRPPVPFKKKNSTQSCVLPDISTPLTLSQGHPPGMDHPLLQVRRMSSQGLEEQIALEKCREWVTSLPDKFSGMHTVITIPASTPGYGDDSR